MSKQSILDKIRSLQQKEIPAPVVPEFKEEKDIVGRFLAALEANHAQTHLSNSPEDTLKLLERIFDEDETIVNASKIEVPDAIPIRKFSDPHELKTTDRAVVQAQLGVAENGAMWLSEADLGLRALPFITQHLVVVIKVDTLVQNMHVAYTNISIDKDGFGVFIAGPSKTADIEQSLVIGAHGPKSMMVIVEQFD